jgi:hypothetical protein
VLTRERLVVDAEADGSFVSRFTVEEAHFLPRSPGSAYDARPPYDYSCHPVRGRIRVCALQRCVLMRVYRQMRRDHEPEE